MGARHGGSYSTEYNCWAHMLKRTRPNARPRDKRNYFDRGIRVCDRWRVGEGSKSAFECFLSDMGNRPSPSHSIDRIDNNGNYEPANCKWSTPKEQSLNQRKTKILEYKGVKYNLEDAAKRFATVSVSRIYQRLREGWTVAAALETPNISNGH